MNPAIELLSPARILTDIEASSKKRVLEEFGLLFERQENLSRAKVTDTLLARERLGSTALGYGVALPHGRMGDLRHPLSALIRVRKPIPYEASDGQPVGLFIALLVPEAATQKHLELLSAFAELLSNTALRDQMMQAESALALHGLLQTYGAQSAAAGPSHGH